MPDTVARLKTGIETGKVDEKLLEEALREITALREKSDALEELFILLVRTGFPWDDEGTTNEGFGAFRERYQRVIHEAAQLLGLELRSMITRTEPKT